MFGYGILYYSSGIKAYDGQWENDTFHGFGWLYNENPEILATKFDFTNLNNVQEYWIKYQGEFRCDVRQG